MRQHGDVPGIFTRCGQFAERIRRRDAAVRLHRAAFKIEAEDLAAGPVVGFRHLDRADLAQANAVAVARVAYDIVCAAFILKQPVFPQLAVFEKAIGLPALRVDVQVGIGDVRRFFKGNILKAIRSVCKNQAGKRHIDAAEMRACGRSDMVPHACAACACVVDFHYDVRDTHFRRGQGRVLRERRQQRVVHKRLHCRFISHGLLGDGYRFKIRILAGIVGMDARISEVVRILLHDIGAGIVLIRPLVVGRLRIAAVAGGKIRLDGRTVVEKHLPCRSLHRLRGVWRVGGDAAVDLAAARIVNVEEIRGTDAAHGIIARNDRLRLERFRWRIVADLKGQHADEVILNVDAVDEEKPLRGIGNAILRRGIPAVELAKIAIVRAVDVIHLDVVPPFALSRRVFLEIERRRAVKQFAVGAPHLEHTLRRIGVEAIVRFRRDAEYGFILRIAQGIAPVEIDHGSRMIRREHHADIALIQLLSQRKGRSSVCRILRKRIAVRLLRPHTIFSQVCKRIIDGIVSPILCLCSPFGKRGHRGSPCRQSQSEDQQCA